MDTNIAMLRLMGGSGAPMRQGEVCTAIQSGILEGGENNESIYANLSHDEVAPYYSCTPHLMFLDYLISSPGTLDRRSRSAATSSSRTSSPPPRRRASSGGAAAEARFSVFSAPAHASSYRVLPLL